MGHGVASDAILLRARFAGRVSLLVVFAVEHLGRVELDVSVSSLS
jgi:hypothetical protein